MGNVVGTIWGWNRGRNEEKQGLSKEVKQEVRAVEEITERKKHLQASHVKGTESGED